MNSLVLDGTRGDVTISGDSFRWAFGLRSDWFTVEPTPIISRWSRLGGTRSPLGAVRTREYAVESGSAQAFDRGRIYYSKVTGARELYGPILRAYRQLGGPASTLGLPRTGVQARKAGFRTRFQGGLVYSRAATGTVPVLGAIADRYLRLGGVWSDLGWPTETNFAISGGERVNFEHGYITWSRKDDSTRVRVTG